MAFPVWGLIAMMVFHAVAVDNALASDSESTPAQTVEGVAAKQLPSVEDTDLLKSPLPRPAMEGSIGASEAAQNAQCRWLGTRIVSLLSRDDAMTARDFNPFYQRFGCPQEHLSEAFGCVVGGAEQNQGEELASRVDRCWADPVAGLQPKESLGDAEPKDDGQEGKNDQEDPAEDEKEPASGGT